MKNCKKNLKAFTLQELLVVLVIVGVLVLLALPNLTL
ncbi:prepilin-type N-terminal cleavage/methylation domain-containing protein [Flammeovirga sp. MY04]|nr:prepilin-type N-terminal cleavage/methylation domain-containing protein [Flammeovirga sp. MY04]